MKKAVIVILIIGALFLMTFRIVGGSVDVDGFLHEPFFLLPLGEFLIFIGLILSFVLYLKKRDKNASNYE